ncbi:FkbM family methyltransferase [Salinisphaera sp. Q1T1-3]|uniref:FkbM family methyltransferase n=1 Tax=Salinisphaera sp. Q1T1-3 TaxID=2321229 RepID=UPI000E75134D|nr:FkbM family methyltransferase [Salinisphaera sp. Q1T1-3]RJS92530.1 FkbM family methyltransferase [Salinisphaera sp. Q1T1-3]
MTMRARLGLWRSIVIYHAQPWRTRALRRFYARLLQPGMLAFDIGAHVGNRSRALAQAGLRVVAVEPQPICAAYLARTLGRDPRVTLRREALGAVTGTASLRISSRHPTVSTLASDWIDAVSRTTGFMQVRWDQTAEVPVLTLDALIAAHGRPDICKIDVEGHEAAILQGLSQPLDRVVFEYLPVAPDTALACIDRLSALADDYRYNWVIGERHRWARADWGTAADCRRAIEARPRHGPGWDIYACRTGRTT